MSWFRIADSTSKKIDEVKRQAAFIASSIYVIFFIVVGFVEQVPLYGVLLTLLMFLTFYLANKNHVDASFIMIIVASEVSSIYILLVKGETTGIPLLLLSYILVAVCFHSVMNWILLFLNICVLTFYMVTTKQLGTNIMFLRFLTQIIFCVVTYLCSFSIQKLLLYVERAEAQKQEAQMYLIQNRQLKAYQKELIQSSRLIIQAISSFEQGATRSRVQTQGNLFPEIAYMINNILQRQEDLLKTKKELEKVSTAAQKTASQIHFAKVASKPVQLSMTGSEIDPIISELNTKFITDKLTK